MNPFDFVNSINSTEKKDLVNTGQALEDDYVPFIVNKALSYFPETILYSNQINALPHLDKTLQYHYLLNTVRPGKRFAKWVKRENVEDIEAVKEYYGYSIEKAHQALAILTVDNLNYIKQKLQSGRNNDQIGNLSRSDASKR